jgi:hypothetical protein
MRYFLPGALICALGVGAIAQEDTTSTDWLPLVEGYEGEKVGARMRTVEADESTGGQTLVISIPKIAISDPSQMEEVVVVGQAPEDRKPLFDFKYEFEWLDDYEDDNYGLLIRLGKGNSWPIRVFMRSDDGPRSEPDLGSP